MVSPFEHPTLSSKEDRPHFAIGFNESEIIALSTLMPGLDSWHYRDLVDITSQDKIMAALANIDSSEKRDKFAALLQEYLYYLYNPPQTDQHDIAEAQLSALLDYKPRAFNMLSLTPEQTQQLNQNTNLPPIIAINGVSCSGKDAAAIGAQQILTEEGYNIVTIGFSDCILEQAKHDIQQAETKILYATTVRGGASLYHPEYWQGRRLRDQAESALEAYSQARAVDPAYTMMAVDQVVRRKANEHANTDNTIFVLIGGPRYFGHLTGFYPGFLHRSDRSMSPAITDLAVPKGATEISFEERLPLDGAISLSLDWQQAISRMIGRVIHTTGQYGWDKVRRDDLNPPAYENRWKLYGQQTRELMHQLPQFLGVDPYKVDANKSKEDVSAQVARQIKMIASNCKRELV